MSTVEKQAALLVDSPISRKSSRVAPSILQQQTTIASKPQSRSASLAQGSVSKAGSITSQMILPQENVSRSASLAQRSVSKVASITSQIGLPQENVSRSASTSHAKSSSIRAGSKASEGAPTLSKHSNSFSRTIASSRPNSTQQNNDGPVRATPISLQKSPSNTQSWEESSRKNSHATLQASSNSAFAAPTSTTLSKSSSTVIYSQSPKSSSYHVIKPISSLAGSRKESLVQASLQNPSRLSRASVSSQNKLSLVEKENLLD